MMELDEVDINILKTLQDNGRLSFRQVSEKVKVSVPTVSHKIADMENLGIIRGYQAVLDTERLGELSVILTVKAKPSELNSVAERFRNDENVRKLFILSNSRLHMICTFSNSHLINDFVSRLGEIPEIIEYEISNIIQVVKENQRALVVPNLKLILQCQSCKKDIKGEPVRIKSDRREYFFCSNTCAMAFQEKMEKLKAKPQS
ncbi:MAG: winged helix-turn-helix transcriptional regulator [Methanomassiliicoccales archaeon]|nr:winged helix-turn-helix transcriptional regulator [Methanomassiliicoccales archaeon]